MVERLERDLPELLLFFSFPRSQWRKLRNTNVIECCFVEERRRTRPMARLCERRKRRSDHPRYLQWHKRKARVEKSHPPAFYAGSLTIPPSGGIPRIVRYVL